jgi:hypothetical protein
LKELITLRETHDEYHVNGDETQQVSHNHSVNHDDERPNFLEASAISQSKMEEEIFRI